MSVYLGVINRDAFRQSFLHSFILRLSSLKIAMRCNFWSFQSPFLFLLVLLFSLSHIYQRINLNWDDKEKEQKIDQTNMSIHANEWYNQYSIVRWHYHSFLLDEEFQISKGRQLSTIKRCFMTWMICTQYYYTFHHFLHLSK